MEIAGSTIQFTVDDVKRFCLRHYKESSEENLRVVQYDLSSMGNAPKGFLGRHEYLNVLIQRKTKTGVTEEKVRFFIKTPPLDVPAYMDYVEGFGVFKKEVDVYKNVIPRLQHINIESEYFAPVCYLAKSSILVFENLADQGFRMGTKPGALLDFQHLDCCLKALANIHAASIVLEERSHKSIQELYPSAVVENAYPSDPENIRSVVFRKGCAALCTLIKEIPKYQNSPDIPIIFEKIMEKIFDFCKPSKRFRNTFTHGDLWANNIMFRYSRVGTNTVPVECRLVDYQLARYAPPALDVLTLLTIPTTKSFREEHLRTLLNNYYSYLSEFLQKQNIDVEEIISRREFDESVECFKLSGLIESCLFSHWILLPQDYSSDMMNNSDDFQEFLIKQREAVCQKLFREDQTYRDRVTDMVSDVIDTYILAKHPVHKFV